MLRIYTTVIEVIGMLRPVIAQIESHDRDLARQLRRAAASVALNVSEGSGCSGGTRRERYRNALGSARETGACLDVAIACGTSERSMRRCSIGWTWFGQCSSRTSGS